MEWSSLVDSVRRRSKKDGTNSCTTQWSQGLLRNDFFIQLTATVSCIQNTFCTMFFSAKHYFVLKSQSPYVTGPSFSKVIKQLFLESEWALSQYPMRWKAEWAIDSEAMRALISGWMQLLCQCSISCSFCRNQWHLDWNWLRFDELFLLHYLLSWYLIHIHYFERLATTAIKQLPQDVIANAQNSALWSKDEEHILSNIPAVSYFSVL